MQNRAKTAMIATIWLAVFAWSGYVAYSTWLATKRIFMFGEPPLQMVTALIAGAILTLPIWVVALQVTRRIAPNAAGKNRAPE